MRRQANPSSIYTRKWKAPLVTIGHESLEAYIGYLKSEGGPSNSTASIECYVKAAWNAQEVCRSLGVLPWTPGDPTWLDLINTTEHRVQELVNLICLRRTNNSGELLSPARWRCTLVPCRYVD